MEIQNFKKIRIKAGRKIFVSQKRFIGTEKNIILTADKRSFEIKGIAKQALIAGAKFERIYSKTLLFR